MIDELKNMPASRKRLFALLGVVLIFAFYMLVINKPGGSSNTPQPSSSTATAPADSSGSAASPETGAGASGTDGGAASPGGDSDLPADPTQNQRPGATTEQKLPSRFPGTQPVVLVYNPFQATPDGATP